MNLKLTIVAFCLFSGCAPRPVGNCVESGIDKALSPKPVRVVKDLNDGETAYVQIVYLMSNGDTYVNSDGIIVDSWFGFHEGVITRRGSTFCVRIDKILTRDWLPNRPLKVMVEK